MRRASPEMTILAANLSAHRRVRRLTRRQVEKDTGISPDVLRRYENDPGSDVYLLPIVKLARYYSTTVENLLTDPDPTIPPPVLRPRKSRRRQ